MGSLKQIHHSSRNFSVKSTYATIVNHNTNAEVPTTQHPSIWKKMWYLQIQYILKLFIWKVFNNILLMRSLLENYISLSADHTICPIYNFIEETTHHLFLECSYSRIFWRQSPWPLKISSIGQDLQYWVECILDPVHSFQMEDTEVHKFQLFNVVGIDNLWFYRNQIVHDSIIISIEQFVSRVSHSHKDHCNAWYSKGKK